MQKTGQICICVFTQNNYFLEKKIAFTRLLGQIQVI